MSSRTLLVQGALDPDLRALFSKLIEHQFGIRVAATQAVTLDRLVIEAARESGCETPRAFYQALFEEKLPHLLQTMATKLTIGETHFFRVGPQIEALRSTILSDIIERRGGERKLRIWIAGCSTGEEPYTLAILLRERLPEIREWDVKLLATDINDAALEAARRASYGSWSFRDTPDEVRQRYFRLKGSRWHLVEPVRRMVEFVRVNLAGEPLNELGLRPGELDLILCRNVTIYFSSIAAQQLYQHFEAALSPEAWLILGPSDPAPERSELLQTRYMPGAVLWQKGPRIAVRHRSLGKTSRRAAKGLTPEVRPPDRVRKSPNTELRDRVPAPRIACEPRGEFDRLRLLLRQDRDSARAQAEALVRDGTLEAEVYILLGMIYLDEASPVAAIEVLRRANFLQVDNPLAYFGLGTAYRQTGQIERSRAALLHARRLLTTSPVTDVLPDTDAMTVGDLRHAVEVQLGRDRDTCER